jgi:hypothetical protein
MPKKKNNKVHIRQPIIKKEEYGNIKCTVAVRANFKEA